MEFSQVWVNNNGNLTLTIRQTEVGMTAYRTGGNYGQAVSTADQKSNDPSNYVNLVDDETDLAGDGTTTDIQYNTNLIAQGEKGGRDQPELGPHHAQAGAAWARGRR